MNKLVPLLQPVGLFRNEAQLLQWWLPPHISARQTYLATVENPPAVPTILLGLPIPLAVAAVGLW